MPLYSYVNPITGEIKEIIQTMNEVHDFTDEKGVKWNRIFTIPNAAIDSQINPFSSQDFINKTKNKKGMTLGDAFDESKRLSLEREKITGKDSVKESTLKEYKKKTKGISHPNQNT